MNRETFLASPDVNGFVHWAAARLPSLPIALDVSSTRYVPGGLRVEVTGLQQLVPRHYLWRATGMSVGDWAENTALIGGFSTGLRQAVSANDTAAALAACWRIVEWGGGRRGTGAYPFLQGLGPGLCHYIRLNAERMALDDAGTDTDTALVPGGRMNAMLTKVHAFHATDGLPIYDSRVAGAAATLVEGWRRGSGQAPQPLPTALAFPAVAERPTQDAEGLRRTVRRRFPDAIDPGRLYHASPPLRWAGAKVRLGWLMQAILARSPALWAQQPEPARMRCLEAALFMVGYDVACLWPSAAPAPTGA